MYPWFVSSINIKTHIGLLIMAKMTIICYWIYMKFYILATKKNNPMFATRISETNMLSWQLHSMGQYAFPLSWCFSNKKINLSFCMLDFWVDTWYLHTLVLVGKTKPFIQNWSIKIIKQRCLISKNLHII